MNISEYLEEVDEKADELIDKLIDLKEDINIRRCQLIYKECGEEIKKLDDVKGYKIESTQEYDDITEFEIDIIIKPSKYLDDFVELGNPDDSDWSG
ncbi:MAG: hypothetical protein ACOC5T_06230, partial [Elusimicrobiota bacterium]